MSQKNTASWLKMKRSLLIYHPDFAQSAILPLCCAGARLIWMEYKPRHALSLIGCCLSAIKLKAFDGFIAQRKAIAKTTSCWLPLKTGNRFKKNSCWLKKYLNWHNWSEVSLRPISLFCLFYMTHRFDFIDDSHSGEAACFCFKAHLTPNVILNWAETRRNGISLFNSRNEIFI